MNAQAAAQSIPRDGDSGRWPWVAVAGGLAALAIAAVPGLAERLRFDRAALAHEPWRLLTGHFAHASPSHLAWDVAAFAVLCLVAERTAFARCVGCLLLSALAIPLVLLVAQPDLDTYCGLSGLDSALFTLLAVAALRRSITARAHTATAITGLLTAGFLAKVLYEVFAGAAVFVDAAAVAAIPVPLAHVTGAAVGALCASGTGSKLRRRLRTTR